MTKNLDSLPWVVSVDDHVVEPPHLWTARLPKADGDRGPRVVQDTCETVITPTAPGFKYVKGGDGPLMDWWIYEDVAKPIQKVVACAGIPIDEHTVDAIRYSDMRPGCYDPSARLKDMDLNRTERSLCFPYVPRFAGQMFLEANDKGLALRCVRAYNDWMIEEWCGDSSGRLIPLIILPLWDPGAAAQEIYRNAARGCRAISFTEMPHYLGLSSIHDPNRYWDPVFQACDETHSVLCMHFGSGSQMVETSPYAPRGVQTTLTHKLAQVSLVEWLLSGILARFKNIKIAYSESQVGWMPFILERVDKVFEHRAWAGLDPSLTELPTSYIPGRVFACIFDDDFGIATREHIGVEQITLEVDYPHQDSTWPHTNKVIERIAAQVSADELDKIVRTNALNMLGL